MSYRRKMSPSSSATSWRPEFTHVGLLLLSLFVALQSLWSATESSPTAPELRGHHDENEKRIGELEIELTALKQRIRVLEAQPIPSVSPTAPALAVAELTKAIGASKPKSEVPAPSKVVREENDHPVDPAQQLEHQRKVTEATVTLLNESLLAEVPDTDWSARQEQQILNDLDNNVLGSAYIVDNECRSTLCRVEVEHPEPHEVDRLMMELMSKPAFAGRQAFIEQATDSGSGRMTIYLARQGQRLPRHDAE